METTPEDNVIEEVLEGVDLIFIAEKWQKYSLATIREEKIHRIEGAYLLQEELKQITLQKPLDDQENKGILADMTT